MVQPLPDPSLRRVLEERDRTLRKNFATSESAAAFYVPCWIGNGDNGRMMRSRYRTTNQTAERPEPTPEPPLAFLCPATSRLIANWRS